MQPATDLVGPVVKLAAGADLGHHQLQRRNAFSLVHADGDAHTVILDRDAVVFVQRDLDAITTACERLVDGVVDHFVNEMMECAAVRAADVHAGPQTDVLDRIQLLDVVFGVGQSFFLIEHCNSMLPTAANP